jgi:hypothetical protein
MCAVQVPVVEEIARGVGSSRGAGGARARLAAGGRRGGLQRALHRPTAHARTCRALPQPARHALLPRRH